MPVNMSPSNSKLLRVSKEASAAKNQHLLFTLDKEGKVRVDGNLNLVRKMADDEPLFKAMSNKMREGLEEDVVPEAAFYPVNYPMLPCAPSHPDWKKSAQVRAVLRSILTTLGYGKGGSRRLGVPPAPLGWPAEIPWESYAGSTRAGLSSSEITQVIVSMMTAAGLDPETHVKEPDEEGRKDEVENEVDEHEDGNDEVLAEMVFQVVTDV